MSTTNRLVFNVTDAETIAASSSVGAFVRAGDDGTLIGHVADALKVSVENESITVIATDFDIRDLTQTDEITVFQGTSPWVVSATDLDIRDITHVSDSIRLGDGTNLLTSTLEGAKQALDVYVANDIDVEIEANVAIENTAKSVTTTSAALLAAQLADRKYMFVQNLGNKLTYIGKSGVTTANGLQMAPGVVYEFSLGPAVSMHAVSEAGSQDVRIMELS